MARDARTAIQRGYDCLKVKVGIDPELDVARLAAVREAVGKDVKLRIDANQAWNAKQAVRILDQMQEKGLDIEFVEQPVPAADLEGMQYVTRHASVPVLADESVFSPADALRIMQTGAADFVNIKLMKCGGITNALRIASAAEVYGVECMIGCMLDVPIHSGGQITGMALSARNVSDEEMQKRFFDMAVEESSIYPWQFDVESNSFIFPQGFLVRFGYDESITSITRDEMDRMVYPEDLKEMCFKSASQFYRRRNIGYSSKSFFKFSRCF